MSHIKEARKLMFREEISKIEMTVELNEVGWIRVSQFKGAGGLFGQTDIYAEIRLTTEDARNLIKCLREFVPEQEEAKDTP